MSEDLLSPMKVPFSKYYGLGNDFILIDNRKSPKPMISLKQAIPLCDRHFGIGGDGVIFALPGNSNSDFGMRIFNSDGTEKIPTTLTPTSNNTVIQQTLEVKGDICSITTVSMGNPHACVYTKNGQPVRIEEIQLTEIGLLFEYNEVFPARACTEFVEVIDRDHVKMVVWERGPRLTLACGTGACALVVVGVLEGRLNRKCQMDAPGGSLQIEWNEDNDRVYKTGPAEYVFSGSFHI